MRFTEGLLVGLIWSASILPSCPTGEAIPSEAVPAMVMDRSGEIVAMIALPSTGSMDDLDALIAYMGMHPDGVDVPQKLELFGQMMTAVEAGIGPADLPETIIPAIWVVTPDEIRQGRLWSGVAIVNAAIWGHIRDPTGMPVAGVRVDPFGSGGCDSMVTWTDAGGYYELSIPRLWGVVEETEGRWFEMRQAVAWPMDYATGLY